MGKILEQIICCPICKKHLRIYSDYYDCPSCARNYPIMFGIPDFRVTDLPPNYRNKDQDLYIAKYLYENFNSLDLRQLTIECVVMQDKVTNTSSELTKKYINYRLNYKEKFETRKNLIYKALPDRHKTFSFGSDFGCGSGVGIVSLIPFCNNIIGIDIQISELIVAKKLLLTLGVNNFYLFAGSLEKLPFKPNSIEFATAFDVLEHIQDQEQHIKETDIILNHGGYYFFNVPNRYAIGYEPHVQIRGVGFIPRPMQDLYVRVVSLNKKRYEGKKLLSYFELKKLLKKYTNMDFTIFNEKFQFESQKYHKGLIFYKRIKRKIFNHAFYVLATKN